MGDEIFVRLRDCFTAGYTLPQYCIDKGIRKPLFVSEKKYELFLWKVRVQFHYDKRLVAQFCFIDSDPVKVRFPAHNGIIAPLIIQKFSSINLDNFDAIILLTKENIEATHKKIIHFAELEQFFIRKTYAEIPLLHFLQRNPKVKLFLTNFPNPYRFKEYAKFKSQLQELSALRKILSENKSGNTKSQFSKFGYTNAQVLDILNVSLARTRGNIDGTTEIIEDDTNPFLGVRNGKRMTAYQPENFQNKIHFFGTCHQYGMFAPCDKTIESYLQKMLNEANLPWRVENESQLFWGSYQNVFYNLNKFNLSPGDIIFIFIENLRSIKDVIPFCDVSDAFDPPNDYREVFCEFDGHVNELGYKLLAEKYFKFLTDNNFFRDVEFNYPIPPPMYHRYGIPSWVEQGGVNTPVNKELEAYKQTLRPKKLPIGALVMNCNPFTLGHLHLVEYAAAKVVKLYIFVVEEDKSEFPFADRIELVRQGVKNFSNVEVLPSGKFIISQTTFSGYFNKASLQDVAVDSSEDVEIFGKEIAPTLGITVRFAGEEPKDNVTRQYNETMKRILPRYGIEFCEIPRKEFDGEPISASTVREAIKNGDIDKVKNLVPETTFNYLCKRYSNLTNRYFTARVDIKLTTTEGDFEVLSTSDDKANVKKSGSAKQGGIGYQIQSCAGKLEFIAKSTVDGQIWLYLGGLDVRCLIDYAKLTINGQKVFDNITPARHDEPYVYNMGAQANEEIKIQIEWLPHKNNI